ncbi:MAG: ABC transporter permease [Gaiellaceae bacterium]
MKDVQAAVAFRSSGRSLSGVVGRSREVWRSLTRLERAALVILIGLVVLAAIGPIIAPHPPEQAVPSERLLSPSFAHPFGTDENGSDILSRILAAPRIDVTVGVAATLLSVGIGAPLGVLIGFFEGGSRRAASLAGHGTLRLLDVIQAFPVFIFAMVLVAVRGTGVANLIIAISFVNLPVFIRLTRSELLRLREQPYAEAARAVGNSDLTIAFKHLLPNALAPVMVQVSVTIGFSILLTAGLSFVGAGVSPPTPELGAMIASGSEFMVLGDWWVSVLPGLVLAVAIFSFGVCGEILERLLQPGAGRGGGWVSPGGSGAPLTGAAADLGDRTAPKSELARQ